MSLELTLSLISNSTNYSEFKCHQKDGKNPLESFFKKHAYDNQIKHLSKTWIVQKENKIVGYFSLAAASVSFTDIADEHTTEFPNYDRLPGIINWKICNP